MKKLKPNFKFTDQRGDFLEIWRGSKWKEMNFFSAKAGAVRGSHYHKRTNELFFVVAGRCEVEIINVKTKRKKKFIAGYQDIFLVEPYELHFIKALEPIKIVTLLDKAHNEKNPDNHQ